MVKEVAKQGDDFRTLNKVLAEDDMEQVLKHYYIRVGGNLRALDLILRNVSREGQKGADVVIKRVEQWYKERVEPIERKLGDQEEGLSPPGGRGRTHGVFPRERRRHQNEVEASS